MLFDNFFFTFTNKNISHNIWLIKILLFSVTNKINDTNDVTMAGIKKRIISNGNIFTITPNKQTAVAK